MVGRIIETEACIAEGAAGPDGPVYPGTCRGRTGVGAGGRPVALRFDMARALATIGGATLTFEEIGAGPDGQTGRIVLDPETLIQRAGDIALARKDIGTSYHLSVVVDDAAQSVTHVTRGRDLFAATAIHRLLQAVLDLPTPVYRHHRLIRDEAGRRLAKRDDARAIRTFRTEGATPRDVRRMVGLD
jgi:glutamyl-Q tRNA(Asp) synthetase